MDQEFLEKFAQQDRKLEAIQKDIRRMRKFAMWRMIIMILVIFIPLVGLSFVIPAFLKTLPNLSSLGF